MTMTTRELRERAAVAAMGGLLADPTPRPYLRKRRETCAQATARLAVEHADLLISALKPKSPCRNFNRSM